MLVLWDPTYVERLWCVFELAAFLKSRESGTATKLFIRPTILGPQLHGILLGSLCVAAGSDGGPMGKRVSWILGILGGVLDWVLLACLCLAEPL